jgi:hypothetical protein
MRVNLIIVERRLNMQRLLPKVAQSFLCLLVALLFAGCSNSYYSGPVLRTRDGIDVYPFLHFAELLAANSL